MRGRLSHICLLWDSYIFFLSIWYWLLPETGHRMKWTLDRTQSDNSYIAFHSAHLTQNTFITPVQVSTQLLSFYYYTFTTNIFHITNKALTPKLSFLPLEIQVIPTPHRNFLTFLILLALRVQCYIHQPAELARSS